MTKVSLVTCVSGLAYEMYAKDMFKSAELFFHPGDEMEFVTLPAREGWPAATMYRYHVLLENLDHITGDYIFMTDADMRFMAPVGPNILAVIVATQHPGYVGQEPDELPYERRTESMARMPFGSGDVYFCGGFIGGARLAFIEMARVISRAITDDARFNVTARWHDESHLNHALSHSFKPSLVLDPGYCYPANDAWYKTIWKQRYRPRLVALDKTPEERGDR